MSSLHHLPGRNKHDKPTAVVDDSLFHGQVYLVAMVTVTSFNHNKSFIRLVVRLYNVLMHLFLIIGLFLIKMLQFY